MANPNYEGQNFKIEGGKLTLFQNTWGLVSSSNGLWIVYDPAIAFLGFATEMNPSPVAHKIAEIIQNDIGAGRDHLIAYVGLNPLATLQLWLEGVMKRTHLENCREGEDEGGAYIEFDNVVLGGKPRTVRVYQEPEYSMATYDAQGAVV